MAPYSVTTTVQEPLAAGDKQSNISDEQVTPQKRKSYFGAELIWSNIIGLTALHCLFLYGLFTFPFLEKKGLVIYSFIVGTYGGLGVTAGVHRLWCHRSYKATLTLRILLMIAFMSAGQNTIYEWVRDHRVHHRFSETDADPHNSNRGFFFSHCGWLMMRKHPDVHRKGKRVDMSDILNDPVVQFEEKYADILRPLFCFLVPTLGAYYLLDESIYWSFLAAGLGKQIFLLNATWSVNSAAHIFGTRPYDRSINPRENKFVAVFAMGEGWHNYHHKFPWDYRTSELGRINVTTFWINLFAKIGWAYDLKTPSERVVAKTIVQNGDGSYDWGKKEIPESEDGQ